MEERTEDRYDMFIYLISGIYKNIQRIRNGKANEDGIKSVNTMWLLQLRNETEGITASELAQKCLVDKSLISRELVQMERSGLIRCDITLEDLKYQRKIFLTEKGRNIAGKYSEFASRIQAIISREYNGEDIAIFYRVLHTFFEKIEEAANECESR
ncbi:MAG: hypothetical protein PHW77_07225 [Eubacteriales bacterium]|nr:hypothetical protein [Eubacteriales bacterium]